MSTETIVSIIIGIIGGMIGGLPISFYAGIITTRLIRFYDLRAEAYEALIMIDGSYPDSTRLEAGFQRLEDFSRLSFRFLAQGHVCAKDMIDAIQQEVLADLNAIDYEVKLLETRQKSHPKITRLNKDAQQIRFGKLESIHPTWRCIFDPRFPPRPRPCTCDS